MSINFGVLLELCLFVERGEGRGRGGWDVRECVYWKKLVVFMHVL